MSNIRFPFAKKNSQKKTIKVVLFDLDGTLIDTALDFYEILKLALKSAIEQKENVRKSAFTYKELRSIAGKGADAMIKNCFQIEIDHPKFTVYKQKFLDDYKEIAGTHAKLFAGILELLNQLSDLGIPWAIVTDKHRAFTDKLLQSIKLPPHISVCSDDKEIGDAFRKPHPRSLQLACEKLNLNPTDCVYVGDSVKDIQAGKAANMTTIAVTYGYSTKEDLAESYPDFSVDSPAELIECLRNLLQLKKVIEPHYRNLSAM